MAVVPKTYKVNSLRLDIRNPRIGRNAATQEAAVEQLLHRFGEKIYALARDIAEHGLSPLESWAVVRENNTRVVLEGNRRLLACRMLLDPGFARDSAWERRFQAIGRTLPPETYMSASCSVFGERREARHWIVLKHHGEGDGQGVSRWGPEMVYLDAVSHGSAAVPWNEFWYWLEREYSNDAILMRNLDTARGYQYTTMERVFEALEALMPITYNDGTFTFREQTSTLKPFFSEIVRQMLPRGRIGSRSINKQADAIVLLREIKERTIPPTLDITIPVIGPLDPPESTIDVRPTSPITAVNESKDDTPIDQINTPESGGRNVPDTQPEKRRSVGTTKAESHLFYGVHAKGHHPMRIRQLLVETRDFEIAKRPEVCAVLARIVIELTVDWFLEHRSKPVDRGAKLAKKIELALKEFDPSLKFKDDDTRQLDGVWDVVRTDRLPHGNFIDNLNSCVHNHHYSAVPNIAHDANRIFSPFIQAMLDSEAVVAAKK